MKPQPTSYSQTETGYRVEARTRGCAPGKLDSPLVSATFSETWRAVTVEQAPDQFSHLSRHDLLSYEEAMMIAWHVASISWFVECRLVEYKVQTSATCEQVGALTQRISQHNGPHELEPAEGDTGAL